MTGHVFAQANRYFIQWCANDARCSRKRPHPLVWFGPAMSFEQRRAFEGGRAPLLGMELISAPNTIAEAMDAVWLHDGMQQLVDEVPS